MPAKESRNQRSRSVSGQSLGGAVLRSGTADATAAQEAQHGAVGWAPKQVTQAMAGGDNRVPLFGLRVGIT
jgi:hypothetical protein